MKKIKIAHYLNYFFALIWIVNGLFCKVLNFVPRHQEIVGRILKTENARIFTLIIGLSEILMAIWILSKIQPKLNAAAQILIILLMNFLEFFLVPDLLLWGKLNLIFAILFSALIYYKEFILSKEIK